MKLLYILLVFSTFCFAHEGHVHLPNNQQPPHGGTLQKWDHNFIELSQNNNEVRFYFYDGKLNPIQIPQKHSAQLNYPDKSKSNLNLSQENSFLKGTVDFKNAHRILIDIQIAKQKIRFQIEPLSE